MTTQTTTLQAGSLFAPNKPSAAPVPMASTLPTERTRPYKDFLTPALHRRFVRAASCVLAVCYIEAMIISPPRLLWFWNPLSFHGTRAFLLFASCLAVFIARVANIHVGERITCSGAETIYQILTSFRTAHTVGWYVFSAFLFGEVYLWSRNADASLGWVDHGNPYERSRVNENPLFLRALWLCIAVAQAGLHLAREEDRVAVPTKTDAKKAETGDGEASRIPPILLSLQAKLPAILQRAIILVVPGLAATTIVYFALLRRLIWPFFHRMANIFYNDLAPTDRRAGVEIDRVPRLVWQAVTSSCMLALLWELSNVCFSVYVSELPTRRDQPLTSEVKDAAGVLLAKSKDPNGSLLSGLKSKKEVPKSFALWELYTICMDFPIRRKTLYTEVDRKDGSTWSQISKICLEELTAVSDRIQIIQDPEKAKREMDAEQLSQEQQKGMIGMDPAAPLTLPKIANRGVQQDGDIYQRRRPDFAHSVGNMAKSFGQSPQANNPVIPGARKAIEWGANRTLTDTQRQQMSRQGVVQNANGLLGQFLRTPVGEPFRQTFARRACAVILGVPLSHRVNIVHAARSLSTLCSHAIREDDYGQVAKSVRKIVVAFTRTVKDIESFVAGLAPASSDVLFEDADRRVEEIEEVKQVLREGLESVLLAYGEYADAVGLTKTELREAREALGKGREMVQK